MVMSEFYLFSLVGSLSMNDPLTYSGMNCAFKMLYLIPAHIQVFTSKKTRDLKT